MWDEEDGFFYDVLRLPDGSVERLKVRSMVGLLPLCAVTVFDGEFLRRYPELAERLRRSSRRGRSCARSSTTPSRAGTGGRRLASILDETKLRRVLATMLDETEFLSPHGIRSLSRYHARPPVRLPGRGPGVPRDLPARRVRQRDVRRQLELARPDLDAGERADHPGAAPVLRLLRRRLHGRVSDRVGPADDALRGGRRRSSAASRAIFLRDATGQRPVYGGTPKFQDDPHWRDYILFYEYFHGDNGAGLGASHQTGWTGVIARPCTCSRPHACSGAGMRRAPAIEPR